MVFKPDGVIIESNRAVSEKLHFDYEELIGMSIYELHPADMKSLVEIYLNEILEGKRSFCPLPLISKTGELLYVETKISRGKWNGEDVLFSVSKDVSLRRQAEDTARRIKERYKILFNNINDVVFVHEYTRDGLPGKFLEVNDIACERYGYSREELLGMTPKEIDAPEGYALVPEMMKILVRDKHNVWEGVHLTKSGEKIAVEISNHLFELDGELIILATVRDISDRKRTEVLLKKSEEKYRKIFENIQDIFYQADINGRLTEISPSIERYSGYKPEELIGIKIEEVYLDPSERGNLLQMLASKGEIEDYIIKLKAKDNRDVLVSANVHLLYDTEGKPVGVEGSLRDVTERILAQEKIKVSEQLLRKQNDEYFALNEELKKSNEQILMINSQLNIAKDKAEESDRLKSAFLANMSHEIRTPMNGIIGFSEMLADPYLPVETRETYLRIVKSSCDQLLHIVNDIIDISKIEAGQIELTESSFSLTDLLEELVSFYSPAADEKGLELVIEKGNYPFPGKVKIISDQIKLRQVLDNLLSNAVKFTYSGKIVIKCEISGDTLKIEIQDTGIGISAELQSIVFERFYQVDTSFSKKSGGTGLGLSISKAYVEKMGGRIWVTSEPDAGSTFSFTVPYKPAADTDIPQKHPDRKHHLRSGMTVLVVEDEEINQMYINEILKNSIRTIFAVTGKQAIELIKQHPEVEIVLMDIKLPDINGYELTKIIKSINSRIKVIAQTAFALSGDREKALEAGCSDYITKPVKRDDLLHLISIHSEGTRISKKIL